MVSMMVVLMGWKKAGQMAVRLEHSSVAVLVVYLVYYWVVDLALRLAAL